MTIFNVYFIKPFSIQDIINMSFIILNLIFYFYYYYCYSVHKNLEMELMMSVSYTNTDIKLCHINNKKKERTIPNWKIANL